MTLYSVLAAWMLVHTGSIPDQQINPAAAPAQNGVGIAYFQDRNDCLIRAASKPEWSCVERPDLQQKLQERTAANR